jgi:hypothetical protein
MPARTSARRPLSSPPKSVKVEDHRVALTARIRRPSNGHRTESEREWLQASRLVEYRPSADFFTQLGKCPSDRLAGSAELRSWATRMA